MHALSPAQLVGYLALVLGVSGFLQRDDRRLKLLVTAECFAYVGHFALLGVAIIAAASASTIVRMALDARGAGAEGAAPSAG